MTRASADQQHSITIWSRQNNFAADCDSLLMAVSDPDSPKYGKHLSFDELKKLVYDEEALNAIHAYLDRHGIPKSARFVPPNGEFVKVKAPIATLEKMFAAEFHVFASSARNATLTRSHAYRVPPELAPYVTLITGITDFPMYRKRAEIVSYSLRRQQPGSVVPKLIAQTYRMPNMTDSTPKADMGVFEALGQSFSPSDLRLFQQKFNIPQQDVKRVVGPNYPEDCNIDPNNCAEANLDVQYIMAMAQGAPLTDWSMPDDSGDIFLEWIEQVLQDSQPPQVFSISYGGPEHLQDQYSMTQFSTEVCKLGLRGMTIFVASGDDGVAGYEARGNPSMCGFYPDYPANVPYVTVVGATMGPESGGPEVVCQSDSGSIITSGGGFSNHFSQPSYQSDAVATYLKTAPNLPLV